MSNNYIIKIDLCTTKAIKIEQINNNLFYIYNNKIDEIYIQENYKILVKDQTSHFLNNIYIVKKNCKIKECTKNKTIINNDYKFECIIFDKKKHLTDIEKKQTSNKDIYIIKHGTFNKNYQYILSYNNTNNKLYNIYINFYIFQSLLFLVFQLYYI